MASKLDMMTMGDAERWSASKSQALKPSSPVAVAISIILMMRPLSSLCLDSFMPVAAPAMVSSCPPWPSSIINLRHVLVFGF